MNPLARQATPTVRRTAAIQHLALWRMNRRIGERAALAFFASNLHEQTQAGKLQEAEAAAACRMLDQAGYARFKVRSSSRTLSLHGYPRAVTS